MIIVMIVKNCPIMNLAAKLCLIINLHNLLQENLYFVSKM